MIRGVIQSATALIYQWWTPPVDAMQKHQEEMEYAALRETKLENRILLSANPLIAVDDGVDHAVDLGATAGDGVDATFHLRLAESHNGSQVEIVVHDQAYHLGAVEDVKSIRVDRADKNEAAAGHNGGFDRAAIDFVDGSDFLGVNPLAIGDEFPSASEQEPDSVSETLPRKSIGDGQVSGADVMPSQADIVPIATVNGKSLSYASESIDRDAVIEEEGFQLAIEQDPVAGNSAHRISSSQLGEVISVDLENSGSLELGENQSLGSEDGFSHATYGDQDGDSSSQSNAQSDLDEVVFVDSRVQDYHQLIAGIATDVEVVLLNPAESGLNQIVTALEGKGNLNAIHLISHGSSGTVFLGSQELTVSNVDQYSEQWSAIGEALAETGDLLFYGCSVAEGTEGAGFIASVAEATGADVAASVDSTGSDRLGGDWEFESVYGSLEVGVVVDTLTRTDYAFILAPPRVLSVEVDDLLITDADIGGTFTVTVTFDQAMDISVSSTPTLTFDPDVIPSGGETLINPSAGLWSLGDTVFTRTYEVVDAGVEFPNVEIDVTGAQSAGGQSLSNYVPNSDFSIDTLNPTVAVNFDNIQLTSGDLLSEVTFEFSEEVTGFDETDLIVAHGAITEFTGSGGSYTATYTAANGFTGTGSVALADGSYTDAALNMGTGGSDSLSIDTEDPSVESVERANADYTNTAFVDFTVTFSENVTGIDVDGS
ncbi:DUF4347 domain-containing protein, partial [bacterium]|nr:DUF4347 domain-containing protein [bacterium]